MPLSQYLPFWKKLSDESNSEGSLASANSISAIDWLWRSRESKHPEPTRVFNSFSGERPGAHSKKLRWNSTFSRLPFIRWKIKNDDPQEGATKTSKEQHSGKTSTSTSILNDEKNLFHEEEFAKSMETSSFERRFPRNEYLPEESPMTTTILESRAMERNEPGEQLPIEGQTTKNHLSTGARLLSESQVMSFNGNDQLDHNPRNSQETGKSVSKSGPNSIENTPSSSSYPNTANMEVILEHQMELMTEAIFDGIAGSIYQILSNFPQIISRNYDRHIVLDEEVQQEAFELLGHTGSLGPLTPLQMACALNDPEIAIILMDFCTTKDLDRTWGRENTALHLASFQGMPDVVKKLLSQKANPNLRNSNGYRPVDCAGDKETREVFIKNRNFPVEDSQTQAVSPSKQIDTITESGHDQNLRIKLSESPKEKPTPRHRRSNHEEQTSSPTRTDETLDHGYSLRSLGPASHLNEANDDSSKKHTHEFPHGIIYPSRPLSSTNLAHVDNLSIPSHAKQPILFDRPTIKRVNFDNNLIFLDCAKNGESIEISDYLENQPIDMHVRNENGLNALHLACQHGQLETVKILLSHGVDINSRDSENWTPLHFAVFEDYVDVVQGLLAHGSDTSIEDNDGKLAVDLASSLHVKRLLSDYMTHSSSTSRSEDIVDGNLDTPCLDK